MDRERQIYQSQNMKQVASGLENNREDLQRKMGSIAMQNSYLTEEIKDLKQQNDLLKLDMENQQNELSKYQGLVESERHKQYEMFKYTKNLEIQHQELIQKSRKVSFF